MRKLRRGGRGRCFIVIFDSARITALVAIAVATLAFSAPSFAAGVSEEDVPSTSIVPADEASSAAPVNSPSSATSPSTAPSSGTWMPPPKRAVPLHHASSKNTVREPEIEPAKARLKVLEDSPVYSAPAKSSKHIEQLTRRQIRRGDGLHSLLSASEAEKRTDRLHRSVGSRAGQAGRQSLCAHARRSAYSINRIDGARSWRKFTPAKMFTSSASR